MLAERAFWFTWSQIQGMGPVLQKRLAQQFGSLAAAWEATPEALQQVEGIGSKLAWAIAQQRRFFEPADALQQTTPFLTPADAAYPTVLYEIPDPPPVLYYQGQVGRLHTCQTHPAVGIVGTRRPSEYGKRWTRHLTTVLSQAGFLIISGLADGIDREAHQSCLDADGWTIAVLGAGVDVVYPHRNRELHWAIAESGLLLSEHPPGTPPNRVHFPRRNRIIAGLSRAILVTEAPRQSGALITAQLANDYGRDVFALPGSLDNHRCHGCLDLVNQGAHLIIETADLLNTLGGIPVEIEPPQEASLVTKLPDLPPDLMRVFQAVPGEAQSLDNIMKRLEDLFADEIITTGEVLGALTQLEIEGLVTHLPGTQYYQRCSG